MNSEAKSEKRNARISPEFRSIRSAFFAVLPNLNYGRAIGQVAGQVTDQVAGQLTDQVTGQVADQLTDALNEIAGSLPVNAKRLLRILRTDMDFNEIMSKIQLSSRGHLRKTALNPALESGFVEMTQPNSPRSPTQKYRLTAKGRELLAYYAGIGTDGKSGGVTPSCTTTKTITKTRPRPSQSAQGAPRVPQETGDVDWDVDRNVVRILDVVRDNPHITQHEIATSLNLSLRGVEDMIKRAREKGLIRRVGGKRFGHWEVVK